MSLRRRQDAQGAPDPGPDELRGNAALTAAAPTTRMQEPEPWPPVRILPMAEADLDGVAALESSLYVHPWTRGNFADSLSAGYAGWVLRPEEASQPLLGYCMLMLAVDELHLLNLSVAGFVQRRGFARLLLDKTRSVGQEARASRVILEVRPSNTRALSLYERYGFTRLGVRRGYYPRSDVDANQPEDAVVMHLEL